MFGPCRVSGGWGLPSLGGTPGLREVIGLSSLLNKNNTGRGCFGLGFQLVRGLNFVIVICRNPCISPTAVRFLLDGHLVVDDF